MDTADVEGDLAGIVLTQDQIHARIAELCREIERDYAGRDLLLVGVLRGAVMVMADIARELHRDVEMDWMAVSSYGAGTQSSGVVRIVKDLDTDITDREVLIVEDIIDSGLTLSWLRENLRAEARHPSRSARCCASRPPRRWMSTCATSASRSRTSSSSATASTTPSATAICATSRCSRRTSTPRPRAASESGFAWGEHAGGAKDPRDSLTVTPA